MSGLSTRAPHPSELIYLSYLMSSRGCQPGAGPPHGPWTLRVWYPALPPPWAKQRVNRDIMQINVIVVDCDLLPLCGKRVWIAT